MTASIVIPAWAWNPEARDLASGCVANIRETAPDIELIMVYAGLTPPPAMHRNVDELIRIDPPQGWAAAANIGLLVAGGDHLVVGSIDIRVPAGWLTELVMAAGTDTITSPLDYKPDGQTRRVWDETMRGSYWGGWFCFHRTILEEVGFLDGYQMRVKADMDWALRARNAGYQTARVPIRAVHVVPHHTLNATTDPYRETMLEVFKERHGVDRFGEWEGLPK